jgi:hypothetical protein
MIFFITYTSFCIFLGMYFINQDTKYIILSIFCFILDFLVVMILKISLKQYFNRLKEYYIWKNNNF